MVYVPVINFHNVSSMRSHNDAIFDSIFQSEGRFYIIGQNDGLCYSIDQNDGIFDSIIQNEALFYSIGQIEGRCFSIGENDGLL